MILGVKNEYNKLFTIVDGEKVIIGNMAMFINIYRHLDYLE